MEAMSILRQARSTRRSTAITCGMISAMTARMISIVEMERKTTMKIRWTCLAESEMTKSINPLTIFNYRISYKVSKSSGMASHPCCSLTQIYNQARWSWTKLLIFSTYSVMESRSSSQSPFSRITMTSQISLAIRLTSQRTPSMLTRDWTRTRSREEIEALGSLRARDSSNMAAWR